VGRRDPVTTTSCREAFFETSSGVPWPETEWTSCGSDAAGPLSCADGCAPDSQCVRRHAVDAELALPFLRTATVWPLAVNSRSVWLSSVVRACAVLS
jgi:hypothetical protein